MTVIIKRNRLCYICPGCKKSLRSPLVDAGKLDHCPHCHHMFTVPELAASTNTNLDDDEIPVPVAPAKPKLATSGQSFGDFLEAMLWRHWVLVAGLILWSPMYIPIPFGSVGNHARVWQDLRPESDHQSMDNHRQPLPAPISQPISQQLASKPAEPVDDSTSRFLHSVSDWSSVRRIFREVHDGYWYDVIYDSTFDRFLRVQCEMSEEVEGTIDLTAFSNQS